MPTNTNSNVQFRDIIPIAPSFNWRLVNLDFTTGSFKCKDNNYYQEVPEFFAYLAFWI
jgi:hypothetical protein